MAKVKLTSGKWVGTLIGGEVAAVSEGEVIEVTDEQAAHLTSDDCMGDFEVVKDKPARAEPAKSGKD